MQKAEGYPCPVCQIPRHYVSQVNAEKGRMRPCRSCANSMAMGGRGMALDVNGNKLCNDCRQRPQKHNSLCSECNVVRRKSYYRKTMRYARYGVTREWFDARFTGKCEICRGPVEHGSVNIDHCHTSGKARGLLCHLCNKGLGAFKDDPQLLQTAANYLEKHR